MPVRSPQLDEPQVGGQSLREVHDEGRAVLAEPVERGGEGAGCVDHDEVAVGQVSRHVVGVGVDDVQLGAPRDHHADRVSRDTAGFRRFRRFANNHRGHDDAPVSPGAGPPTVKSFRR